MFVLDRYALLSVAASVTTMALKAAGYWQTGSVGLLADALESSVNLMAGILLLLALRGARKPADQRHAYGHGKLECVAAAAEGLLVVAAAVGIVLAAWERLHSPVALESLGKGLGFVFLATAVNLVVAMVLLAAGRRHRSLALEADARHLFTDVISSVGLAVALGLMVWEPAWWMIDPLVALGLAVHIAWSGADVVRRAIHGLLDAALDDEELRAIDETLRQAGVEYHDLRTRRAGRQRFVDFHLVLPGGMSVQESHALCSHLEEAICRRLPDTQTVIHVEPCEGEAEGVLPNRRMA